MKVVLAGYNVDKEVLDELKGQSAPRLDVTPETLSAAYARISRDPRPADALRRAAREEVEKARRSNRAIIFKMGHHSVAEHAVFNFDIIGASRLAIEEIERFRLCSYTEKSQRYITLGSDYIVPAEIRDAGEERLFVKIIRAQNALYHAFFGKLRPFVFAQNPGLARDPKKHNLLEGWAKEDARYIVSLATEGQLGMTVNARNLELMIRRFASSPLAEIRDFGRRLHDLAADIAPSIVLFTTASDFEAKAYGEFAAAAARALKGGDKRRASADSVKLIEVSRRGDDTILAALLHSVSTLTHEDCRARVKTLDRDDKKTLFRAAFARMEFYDFPHREFEYADLTFELILSASAFAQLKRHRMATLTRQDYDPDLGVTVPPSIEAVGAMKEFMDMICRTDEVYKMLKTKAGGAAAYVLTNAHRRRALLKINARELTHVSRLREDATAQWDIRDLTARMTALARKEMPLSFMMAGGKDRYPRIYEKIFGKSPARLPPDLKK